LPIVLEKLQIVLEIAREGHVAELPHAALVPRTPEYADRHCPPAMHRRTDGR
jgi:hypothetical protein